MQIYSELDLPVVNKLSQLVCILKQEKPLAFKAAIYNSNS